MTEEEIIKKLETGEKFSEYELSYLLEYEVKDERDEYDERRWSMGTYSILAIGDKYYGLNWDRGLTEMQENYFYSQPVEVVRKEEVVTKTVVTWKEVK